MIQTATRLRVSESPEGLQTEVEAWGQGCWKSVPHHQADGKALLQEVLRFISSEITLLDKELGGLNLGLPLSGEDWWRVMNVTGESFSSESFDCRVPELCFTAAGADYPGCRLTPSRRSVRQLFGGRSTFDKEVSEELLRLVRTYA